MVNEKKHLELLCMFSLNYQILDTSRANYILLQKKKKKKKKKSKSNSIRGCFWVVFMIFFVKSY